MSKSFPIDIQLKINKQFPDHEVQQEMRRTLESFWTLSLNVGPAQLARAILVLAEGDPDMVRKIVDLKFSGDPRDILMQAEAKAGNPGHFFTQPFPQEV